MDDVSKPYTIRTKEDDDNFKRNWDYYKQGNTREDTKKLTKKEEKLEELYQMYMDFLNKKYSSPKAFLEAVVDKMYKD